MHIKKLAFILLLLINIAACAPNTPVMSPDEIIQQSAERMKTTTGFKFLFDRSGAFAYLDVNQTISLAKMEGSYVAPDKVAATVRVIAPGLVAEVKIVSIGVIQWETNVFTGEWVQLEPDWGFNPARLLDPQIGLPSIIATDLTNLVLGEQEQLEEMPGKDLYTITADMAGETINELSYGLMDSDPMKIKMWVAPGTFELYRALITEHPGEGEKERTWLIDFWDFEVLETINPPDL